MKRYTIKYHAKRGATISSKYLQPNLGLGFSGFATKKEASFVKGLILKKAGKNKKYFGANIVGF
jgi:hypothetical protein